MFNRVFQLLLFCFVAGALSAADDPFVGDWKLNPSRSKLTDEMKVESLGANKYRFDFGGGGETILVDGADHAGGFGTTLSVRVEGPKNWKVVRKKDGRMLVTAKWNLSQDNNTLTDDFTFVPQNGAPTNVKYTYKRRGSGSGFAGTWVSTSEPHSAFELQIRPYEGDGLSFIKAAQRVTRNMKFDGKDYRVVGPNVPPDAVSSGGRVNERTLEMTDKIKGKVGQTRQIELSPDLKTLRMTVHPVSQSKPNILVFDRE